MFTNRANKLKINVYQGIDNKFDFFKDIFFLKKSKKLILFNDLIYLGNDINDLIALKMFLFSLFIRFSIYNKKNSNFVGKKKEVMDLLAKLLQHLLIL